MRKALWTAAVMLLLSAPAAMAQEADSLRFVGSRPGGTLSTAVIVGKTIYLSGMLARGETVEEQTRGIMERMKTTLTELGSDMDHVVKCLVFMADLSERPLLNPIYASYFPNHQPARSAIGVDLGGPKVEIECIAVMKD